MSTLSKALLILALLAASTIARSDGIGFNTVGQIEGIGFAGGKAVVIPGCSGTGLIFSVACNSQYIGII